MFLSRHTGILLFLAWVAAPAWSADWPQWRGPHRNGHVPDGTAMPRTLPAEANVVWRQPIGDGLASPVVAAGKVFYLDNQHGKETLHAVDARTGIPSWTAPLDAAFKDSQSASGPRCTPMVEGDRVYAQSCQGELQCLQAASGKLMWRLNFVTDFGAVFLGEKGNAQGAVRHGYDASPLIVGDRLFATVGSTNGASVVCFEKKTGKLVWKAENDQAAYASPVAGNLGGVEQIVVFTADGLIGLGEHEGKLLWRVPVKTAFGRHVTTPVISEDMVIVASHQAGLIGTRILRGNDGLKAEPAWLRKESAMNFSSPVAVGKYLYGLGPARNILCVEIQTGNQRWSQEGYFTSSADKAHAAFLVLGENILLLTDGGQLVLIAADPTACREISRVQVCGFTWCNPAYADGQLFLRDAKELLCVKLLP